MTKVCAKHGLHLAARLPIQSLSSTPRSIDRRFDLWHNITVASLPGARENSLHITVAIGGLHRKQGVPGPREPTLGHTVESLRMVGGRSFAMGEDRAERILREPNGRPAFPIGREQQSLHRLPASDVALSHSHLAPPASRTFLDGTDHGP